MNKPIQIKADTEFVTMLRKMKLDTQRREGIKLSDAALTKIITRKIGGCNWEIDVGKWKIKIK